MSGPGGSDSDDTDHTFGPSRPFGVFLSATFFVTAALLLWLGFLLGPDDREAMDGLQRVFFTVVPIQPFAWLMSVVFSAIGLQRLHHVFFTGPTLQMEETGLRLRGGRLVPWESVVRVERMDDGRVRVHVSDVSPDAAPPRGVTGLLARLSDDVPGGIDFSDFDLGGRGDEAAERIAQSVSRSV